MTARGRWLMSRQSRIVRHLQGGGQHHAAPLRSSSGCHLLGLQVTDDDAVVSRRGVSQLQPKHCRLCLHPLLRPSDGRLLLLRPCRRSHVCRAWPFWRIPQNPWVPTWPSWRQPCQWRRATGTVAAMTARGRWLMSRQSRIVRHLQGGGQHHAAPLRSSSGCHLLGLQVTDNDAVVSQLQPKHCRLCLHPLLRPSDGRLLLLRPCRRSHVCRAWPLGGSLKIRGCQLGCHGGNRASAPGDWHGCRHDGQGPMVDEPPKPHRPASPGRWVAPCSTVALVQRLPLARTAGNR